MIKLLYFKLMKFPPAVVIPILNFLGALLHWKTRIYQADASVYVVKDLESRDLLYICNIERYYLYINGIEKRLGLLAKQYFIDSIAFNPDDLVVDCGANIGELAYYFKKYLPQINYVGVEPSPKEFACLKLNSAQRARLLNIGLWSQCGDLSFYVSSSEADSSFIMPASYTDVINVPVETLDSIVRSQPVRLLKLEAEGAEPEIITGALEVLDNIDYISADLGPERGLSSESTLPAVVNLLSEKFSITDINHHRLICVFSRNK